MSFVESAVVLAWVALVLLALGFAGLLRQVTLLSRRRLGESGPAAPASPRTTRDLVGFRLPSGPDPLASLPEPGAHRTVAVIVSPGCPSCTQTLERLAALDDVRAGSVALVAVSPGSCEPALAALGGTGRCVDQAREVLDRLRVPATPYLLATTADGTIVAAGLAQEDTDLQAWVRQARGSMTLTEERG